jgi:hypothetical protein
MIDGYLDTEVRELEGQESIEEHFFNLEESSFRSQAILILMALKLLLDEPIDRPKLTNQINQLMPRIQVIAAKNSWESSDVNALQDLLVELRELLDWDVLPIEANEKGKSDGLRGDLINCTNLIDREENSNLDQLIRQMADEIVELRATFFEEPIEEISYKTWEEVESAAGIH